MGEYYRIRPKNRGFGVPSVVNKTCNYISEWLSFCKRKYSNDTYTSYSNKITPFAKSLPEGIDSVALEHIEQVIMNLPANYSGRTVNSYITAIKSFYNWLSKYHRKYNLGQLVDFVREDEPKQRVLTRPEYNLICNSDIRRDRLVAIQFLCNTGLRAEEFCSLTPHKVNGDMLRITGKGRKQRSIPLNATANRIVEEVLVVAAKMYPNQLWHFCRHTAKKTGIPPFNPHACRHYFATELYRAGVPIATISKLLGHASSAVTERVYVHAWTEHDLRGVTDVLG